MSTANDKAHQVIPHWVFVGSFGVALAVTGGWLLMRQEAKSEHPIISEIQALNQTGIRDADGDYSDWIEIWNPTDEPIQLEGYHLSDSFRQLHRWEFPERTLEPGEFVVVFASGKDRASTFGELHANFRLAPEGEYLALVAPNGERRVHEILPKYPQQFGDNSFGISPDFFLGTRSRLSRTTDDMAFLLSPTPGAPNENEMLGAVRNLKVSVKRGFQSHPITVALTSDTSVAEIRYTLDGSQPGGTNGTLYVEPLLVTETTTLRAVGLRPGFRSSAVASHSYIFAEDVFNTPSNEVAAETQRLARLGLADIPSVSLMIPEGSMGIDSERIMRASLEFIDPVTGDTEQVDCGLQQLGIDSPYAGSGETRSIRVTINRRYGDPEWQHPVFGSRKPRSFNELILTGGSGDSAMETLLTDAWLRTTLSEMGHLTARGRFVHLFINGEYQGVNNLCELPETPYTGLDADGLPEFDTHVSGHQVSGDEISWQQLLSRIQGVTTVGTSMEQLSRALDIERFAELAVVNELVNGIIFGPPGGWMATRARVGNSPYQLTMAFVHTPLTTPVEAYAAGPQPMVDTLLRNAKFRDLYQATARKLTTRGGAMTPDAAIARLDQLARQLGNAIHSDAMHWNGRSGDISHLRTHIRNRPAEVARQLRAGRNQTKPN